MKKMIIALTAGTLALAAAPAAFATNYTPVNTTVNFTGALTLEQSQTLNCNTTLNVAVNAGGTSASVTGGGVSPGSWQCIFVYPTFSPAWSVAATPTTGTVTTLTIGNVRAVSLTGTCGPGTLVTTWVDGANQNQIVVPRQSIPGVSSGASRPCFFSGALTANTNVTITN